MGSTVHAASTIPLRLEEDDTASGQLHHNVVCWIVRLWDPTARYGEAV